MSWGRSPMASERGRRWAAGGTSVETLLLVMVGPILFMASAACGSAPLSDAAASDDDDDVLRGDGDAILAAAFKDRVNDLPVQGRGIVEKLLKDDTDGDRHQRFIIRLASGQTLLMAHNIDVASRVDGLAVGDSVAFGGVYEWSAEGGTIHWTHHDPDGRHPSGWLRHDAETHR